VQAGEAQVGGGGIGARSVPKADAEAGELFGVAALGNPARRTAGRPERMSMEAAGSE
jgi:hypothetical protein